MHVEDRSMKREACGWESGGKGSRGGRQGAKLGRRLGAIGGGLGWAAKDRGRKVVLGSAEQLVAIGRRGLGRGGRRGLGLDVWEEVWEIKRVLALLSIGPRARRKVGSVGRPELQHGLREKKKQDRRRVVVVN